jgi:hypothetical protein
MATEVADVEVEADVGRLEPRAREAVESLEIEKLLPPTELLCVREGGPSRSARRFKRAACRSEFIVRNSVKTMICEACTRDCHSIVNPANLVESLFYKSSGISRSDKQLFVIVLKWVIYRLYTLGRFGG